MSLRKRLSISSTRSESPLVFAVASNADSEEWLKAWQCVFARGNSDLNFFIRERSGRLILAADLIDSPVVAVDAETTVEDACDYADVNAFLTFAATRHKLASDELRGKPRVQEILAAAKTGRVPVALVSNLSEKNPLEILPYNATVVQLLGVVARGAHRVLIQSESPSAEFLGMVSDRRLLSWFTSYSQQNPAFLRYLANPLCSLALPSMYLYLSVVAARATNCVLDAMKLMSDEGVSTIAVVEEENGNLLSAVSVTDIGKEPDGSTDGIDKYPVYSVSPSSTLFYTMKKLLATESHRLFVTDDSPTSSPTFPPTSTGNLSGIVSTVDVLSLFARVANLPDVDPTRMQRHRRASSASGSSSSHSSDQSSFGMRSRSSSRTSPGRLSVSAGEGGPRSLRNSVSSLESFQWADRVPK
ncbi:uncharacterized protein FIBRA_08260 [Fibroporia radiculosa]|uniref:CBS domain-containing protein n=1 Tax=Fibroporia radiculosa TaxID=599839 RepID=J4IC94_9APHY|nr:uncharacterized protein FIBRA_08260 [Fibroporia radiculosa]CCM06016.1 predicted protein [Fibroporia radiculosa]